ncbi:hypothetical protein [Allonocardiopsis opalescens]|uniref:Uncharacterized protein n=1 Tax=Allonocardiopsis opalescens TaxID=1144618 RepID=A0A2T0Q2J5_9ACTN|nr:hypothetical protein [Allonocardiopsis opalescens]PRX98011.1 hypothetical protein CLV72_105364 [Allonocardiopsis opalescens]
MTESMKGFRCWSAKSVREAVYSDIGALPSSADAVFLAAHSPMVLSHAKGEEKTESGQGERQVLDALIAGIGDADRNTLIAVTGGSGTGKSHVVRWVHAHVDPADERYHVLYVPRAVQTIRELLRRVVAGLPGQGGEAFMKRIDAAVGSTNPAELKDRLLEEMRFALTWTLEPQPPREGESEQEREQREERNSLLGDRDDQGKRRNGLADLLSLEPVNRTLLRTDGRLHRFVASVYERTSRRDDDQEGFEPADLPIRETGLRRALAGNQDLMGMWEVICFDPTPALEMLDEALRKAALKALGMRTSENEVTLDELFRSSRKLLRDQGKELVLLFEDLAQFGLIDGELYDQFATQPGADLAPLRVVFAVTDAPFQRLPDTVQTRITHRFTIEPSALTDRATFVARYLNLVRVGRQDVESAWARSRDDGATDWVRNACDTREGGLPCRFRDECHAGFGAVDVSGLGRIGLYPYNDAALHRSLAARGSDPTPRDVLDVCVSETLIEADAHISRETYPHERVRDRFEFRPQRPKDVVLAGRSGEQAERLYRALVVWGGESHLPPAVTDAFALDAPVTTEPTAHVSQAEAVREPEPLDMPATLAPSPLPQLFQWQVGHLLPTDEADRYRELLFKLVRSRLDLEFALFHTAGTGEGSRILSELFNRTSFTLEGARGRAAGSGRVLFALGRDDESVRVLAAARWFYDNGHWRPEDGIWPWPEGYDPVELMLDLEYHLDDWAEQVRAAFLDRVRGRGLAKAAIGTRAIALMAAGLSPASVQRIGDVLATEAPHADPATPPWTEVDRIARDILANPSINAFVSEFASVRQGDTGAAELVDAVMLEEGLAEFLRSPVAQLRRTAKEFGDTAPVLGKAAGDLLTAVEKATPDQSQEIVAAVKVLADGLQGRAPGEVARAAREVGQLAMDSGFFRPAEGRGDFADALAVLRDLPPELPLDSVGEGHGAVDVIATQYWARAAVRGARALEVIRRSLAETRLESERTGVVGMDLDQVARDVRLKLRQVREHLQAMSLPKEETDG